MTRAASLRKAPEPRALSRGEIRLLKAARREIEKKEGKLDAGSLKKAGYSPELIELILSL